MASLSQAALEDRGDAFGWAGDEALGERWEFVVAMGAVVVRSQLIQLTTE